MNRTDLERGWVERPLCEQLKAMGWERIEGDTDVPDFTERANFREVLFKARSRCGGQPALNGPIQHLHRPWREATVWPASTGQTT